MRRLKKGWTQPPSLVPELKASCYCCVFRNFSDSDSWEQLCLSIRSTAVGAGRRRSRMNLLLRCESNASHQHDQSHKRARFSTQQPQGSESSQDHTSDTTSRNETQLSLLGSVPVKEGGEKYYVRFQPPTSLFLRLQSGPHPSGVLKRGLFLNVLQAGIRHTAGSSYVAPGETVDDAAGIELDPEVSHTL